MKQPYLKLVLSLFVVYLLISESFAEEVPKIFKREITDAFDGFDKLDLYSLKPISKGKESEGFHGYKILRHRSLDDRKVAIRIKQLLLKKAADDTEYTMGCFNPRHGIRINKIGRESIDLLICFECSSMYIISKKNRFQVLFDFPLEDLMNSEIDGKVEFGPDILDHK